MTLQYFRIIKYVHTLNPPILLPTNTADAKEFTEPSTELFGLSLGSESSSSSWAFFDARISFIAPITVVSLILIYQFLNSVKTLVRHMCIFLEEIIAQYICEVPLVCDLASSNIIQVGTGFTE